MRRIPFSSIGEERRLPLPIDRCVGLREARESHPIESNRDSRVRAGVDEQA